MNNKLFYEIMKNAHEHPEKHITVILYEMLSNARAQLNYLVTSNAQLYNELRELREEITNDR